MDDRDPEYVVGRSKEIHKYLGILDECNQEKSMFMHVFGTGGIGKTTFLRVQACIQAEEHSITCDRQL